jgi:hypothetical protein
MKLALYAILIVGAVAVFVHSNHEQSKEITAPVVAGPDDALLKKVRVICLDGFEYYFASTVSEGSGLATAESRAVLAPRFDAITALPRKCAAGTKNLVDN